MKKSALISLAGLLSICFFISTAFAGTTRSISSGSKGFAVRSAPKMQTSGPVKYQSFSSGSAGKNGSTGSGASAGNKSQNVPQAASGSYARGYGGRSMLDNSTTKPSPQLQTIIREKERSGPGWIGTGLLIYLLSQHDLSSSDRQWIQSRLDNEKNSPDHPAPPPIELSDVTFRWEVPAIFRSGEKSNIIVRASQGPENTPHSVSCSMKGIQSVSEKDKAILEWVPDGEETVVVTCLSAGLHDMRMFTSKM